MSNIYPSPSQLRTQLESFLAATKSIVSEALSGAATSIAFREIYKLSLTTNTVLIGLGGSGLRPAVLAARTITVRIPVLISIGQFSVAEVELRRFVELIIWAIYFTDHSVEWQHFLAGSKGFSQDARKPIAHAAHRELSFYLEYAFELMEDEPSGLGTLAVGNLRNALSRLNANVHAGHLARSAATIPPRDEMDEGSLRSFANVQRATFASCSLLLAAYRKKKFDGMEAVQRDHFDWLMGPKLRKDVRKGPFGLG
ncbi:MAG TPA: hypothetical protein VJX47_02335 [Candidatus Sulfotelmatobacter sp.]|nr:hypothetical protein [Candidatus Sulfotelmatobacter sp.]